ncbi:MAG: FecR domain-containing protein [Myxococcales bacterium]|nr:FecR domain-containing protein [Myxococcales bacterium]
MIKSLFPKKPTMPQGSGVLPPAVSWDEVSSQEEALLLKVEADVLHFYDETQEQAKAPSTSASSLSSSSSHVLSKEDVSRGPQKRSFPLGWMWATCGALGLLALLTWRNASTKQAFFPSLRIKGSLELQDLTSPQEAQHLRVLFAPKGELADPQGWSLKAQSQATLHLRRARKKATLRLDHGAVTFWVTPGSMKQFEVSCKNKLRVVVKGTIFSVWQQHASLRVEVYRGHVVLKQGNHGLLHLYKEQGVRIDKAAPSRWKTYRVAPKPQGWLSKIEWMALHQPAHLFDYAQDIERDSSIPLEQRLQSLELASHALTGAKRWKEAFLLWFRLANAQKQGYNAQTAWFQAAQSCRLSQTQRATCIRLYRLFLKRFPRAIDPLRDTSMAWLGRLLYEDPKQKQQARALFRRYLILFPKGSQAALIRRYLKR